MQELKLSECLHSACIAGTANNATVLATNNSESSEVTCSCRVILKLELDKNSN